MTTTATITTLPRLTMQELRARYAELFGETTAVKNRTWLLRRVAWRLQCLAEGDLSERARAGRRTGQRRRPADHGAPRRVAGAGPGMHPALAHGLQARPALAHAGHYSDARLQRPNPGGGSFGRGLRLRRPDVQFALRRGYGRLRGSLQRYSVLPHGPV